MYLQIIPRKRIDGTLILLAFGLGMLAGCCPVIQSFNPESGPAGTEVTCNGERFEGTPAENTVRFGGVTVPTGEIISATTTRIRAKVPTGATTGLISIKNKYCWGESKKNFIVPTTAKWTFMVYLDADNNLESFGIQDFLEMASVGSTAAVNLLVQMDRGGYDNQYGAWTGTRRFLIQKNDTPSVVPLEDMGEQNMGDPTVLRDFVIWGVTQFPAEHYALVIWNHGGGWREQMERLLERSRSFRSLGRVNTAVARAVAWDDTNSDVLYMKEVQQALEGAKQGIQERLHTALKIDVVGFDACVMGMVEVAYALRDVANFMVASEYFEPGPGWPYNTILSDLAANPLLSPKDLAKRIVQKYVDSYPGGSGITQSAMDLGSVLSLSSQIDSFTAKARNEWAKLKEARTHSREYHDPYCYTGTYWGVDLGGFADEVYNRVSASDIKAAALDLKNAVNSFVVGEGHSADMTGSNGIAIYFPGTQAIYNNDSDYPGYEESNTFMPVDFVKYHTWDNWLKDYYLNAP